MRGVTQHAWCIVWLVLPIAACPYEWLGVRASAFLAATHLRGRHLPALGWGSVGVGVASGFVVELSAWKVQHAWCMFLLVSLTIAACSYGWLGVRASAFLAVTHLRGGPSGSLGWCLVGLGVADGFVVGLLVWGVETAHEAAANWGHAVACWCVGCPASAVLCLVPQFSRPVFYLGYIPAVYKLCLNIVGMSGATGGEIASPLWRMHMGCSDVVATWRRVAATSAGQRPGGERQDVGGPAAQSRLIMLPGWVVF